MLCLYPLLLSNDLEVMDPGSQPAVAPSRCAMPDECASFSAYLLKKINEGWHQIFY